MSKFKCNYCGWFLKIIENLHIMWRFFLPGCKKNLIICETCKKTISNKVHLVNHEHQSHTNKGRWYNNVSDRMDLNTFFDPSILNTCEERDKYLFASEQEYPISTLENNVVDTSYTHRATSRTVDKIFSNYNVD